MLREFQEMFVDPEDHSSLSFEGELRNGCWHNGYLYSYRGEIWLVREGIPNFVRGVVPQAAWTDEMIKDLLSNGQYERNWRSGSRILTEEGSGFSQACREAANSGLPIIDIASGPGGGFMPAVLALNPKAVVMVTDAGAPVVYGWKEYFDSKEIELAVCFAAFDAMKMPLASNSVEVITSNGGFSAVVDPLLAFREAARVLTPQGVIHAAEAGIEKEGLKVLSSKMGWDYEEKFGHRYKISFQQMFDECGLNVLRERPYFRRKMRSDDNEIAETAYNVGVELWVGGNVYWLTKRK